MAEQYSLTNQAEKAHLRLEIRSALGSLSLDALRQIHDVIIDNSEAVETVVTHDADDADYGYLEELALSDPSKQPSRARVLSLDAARRGRR